jgi:hypothetical protein
MSEYLQFDELGIDGVCADFPDTAFAARRRSPLGATATSRSPGAPSSVSWLAARLGG